MHTEIAAAFLPRRVLREEMSCKIPLGNSVKLNSEQWVRTPSLDTNVKLAGEEAKDRLYEPKHKKKLVRVLTVIAYLFLVSLAAIMLSLYYVFLWNGTQRESEAMIAFNKTKEMRDKKHEKCISDIKPEKMTMPEVPTVKYEETTFTPQQNVNVSTETAEELQQYNYSRENNFIKKLIAM